MITGALPCVLLVAAFRGRIDILRDSKVRTFLGPLLVVIVGLPVYLATGEGIVAADALGLAALNVVSVVTTTGYASADYLLWFEPAPAGDPL